MAVYRYICTLLTLFMLAGTSNAVAAPEINQPAAGSTLSGSSQTFTWSRSDAESDVQDLEVDQWWLYVGTSVGARDIANSGDLGKDTKYDVIGIPTDGTIVHARLWYFSSARWNYVDSSYTAASIDAEVTTPAMISPANGSELNGASASFEWRDNNTPVNFWWLYLGSRKGSRDIYDSGPDIRSKTSVTVNQLPVNGSTIFARLWFKTAADGWQYSDTEYLTGDGSTDNGDDDGGDSGSYLWKEQVQPALAAQCGDCHSGSRFGFASLERSGADFSDEDTAKNYKTFLDQISLDSPEQSRLLAKVLPPEDSRAINHGGGNLLDESDGLYKLIEQWIAAEKADRCPDCGLTADKAFIAYIDQPSINWALARTPTRGDVPIRKGARLMLQRVDPASLSPLNEPIDFLPQSFCPSDGLCDLGRLASNYNGNELVFECRLPVDNQNTDPLNLSWNLCIAGISESGTAVNPRFLRPEGERHQNWFVSRSDAYGIANQDGLPSRGQYDLHHRMRQMDDSFPVYSPDNERIIFSSRSADPRTGILATRTYHGFEFTNNIISTDRNGTNAQTLYLNEGGLADSPLFLRNGNLAMHVWNLERMDRHLYIQSTADGMMEQPVLFGRNQGRNMWGPITQLSNGTLIGTTGHRRGSVSLFAPFHTDHTIGLGLDPEFPGFTILDPDIMAEMDESFAYCRNPPAGKNCSTSRYYADPSYSPDGRALISHHSRKTYYGQDDNGDSIYQMYGGSVEAVTPFVPELEIAFIDKLGQIETLLEPKSGRSFNYPVFVGKRWAPSTQATVTDESLDSAELHIADFPLWLSFREQQSKSRKRFVEEKLDNIVSVRVLVKQLGANICTNDGKTYRRSTYDTYDHPTHLGINNATGFDQLFLPEDLGGDGFGNIPLNADRSVRLRVPAGEPLLFQGIDKDGHMVAQHSRVFALPPGHKINTSVKRAQHDAQCASCHGSVTSNEFPPFSSTAQLPAEMDFDTLAVNATDLTSATRKGINFLENLRPLLNNKCISCHSGDQPDAELTLEANYSDTANAPHLHWEYALQTDSTSGSGEGYADYLSSIPESSIVRGYNWSPALDFVLKEGDDYINTFVNAAAPSAPIASYAPWDPGYQMLMISQRDTDGDYRYMTDWQYQSQFGRGGDWSKTSFLLEVLTGEDLDPRNNYSGMDHTDMLDEYEIRSLMALIDNGFPFMAQCNSTTVANGPNSGLPWGDTTATNLTMQR